LKDNLEGDTSNERIEMKTLKKKLQEEDYIISLNFLYVCLTSGLYVLPLIFAVD
jgi:hypothetical protein